MYIYAQNGWFEQHLLFSDLQPVAAIYMESLAQPRQCGQRKRLQDWARSQKAWASYQSQQDQKRQRCGLLHCCEPTLSAKTFHSQTVSSWDVFLLFIFLNIVCQPRVTAEHFPIDTDAIARCPGVRKSHWHGAFTVLRNALMSHSEPSVLREYTGIYIYIYICICMCLFHFVSS